MSVRATSDSAFADVLVDTRGAAVVPDAPIRLVGELEAVAPTRLSDRRGRLLRRWLFAADITALCVAFCVREATLVDFRAADALLFVLSIPLWVLAANGHRLYHLDSHRADHGAADELGPVLAVATLWCWVTIVALWLIHPGDVAVPRVALFWVLMVVLVMALRSGARALARRREWYIQDALVIGPASQADAILRKIERHPEWGLRATAFAAVPSPEANRFRRCDDLSVPCDEDLIALVSAMGVDRVMLAPALTAQSGRAELICGLADLGVHVDLVPSWSDVVGARLDLHEMEGMPLLTIPRLGLRRSALRLKRMLDITLSAVGLLMLSPLLVLCAIAVRLDSPGPVLFRQRRIGRDDQPFALLKFRSMCADADERKDGVADLSFHGGGVESGMFKVRDDPRITRVGALLRRYSLDELPQLLNILKGDMSLVGPRPLIENEDRQVEGRFRRRLGLTPGLTGLWQVHGRSDIPFDEMVSLDYLYVTNWSLWGDAKLLMRTLPSVMRGMGAY
jgi:exopolysaccharide biosynthesis polyprenyl glycosylphosphotransferase